MSATPEATRSPEVSPRLPLDQGRKEALGTYVPQALALTLRELSLRLSRERGKRVTISDVVTEALQDFIEKYPG